MNFTRQATCCVVWSACGLHQSGKMKYCLIIVIGVSSSLKRCNDQSLFLSRLPQALIREKSRRKTLISLNIDCWNALLCWLCSSPSCAWPLSSSFSASSLAGWNTFLINTNSNKFKSVTLNLLKLPPCKLFLIIAFRPESTPTGKTVSNGLDNCLVNWDLRMTPQKTSGYFVLKLYFLKV